MGHAPLGCLAVAADTGWMSDIYQPKPSAWADPAREPVEALRLQQAGAAGGVAPVASERAANLDGIQKGPSRWQAHIETDPAIFWARWSHLSHKAAIPSAFQSTHWLRDWYATLGAQPHVEPLLVRVFDAVTGQDKLLMPLIRLRQSGLRILAPADLDVTDTNGPLLQPGLRLDPQGASALWKVLRRELAQHGDVLRINKMLPAAQGQANPLALALTCRPSPSVGHRFEVSDCWDSWHRSLKRQARRESERHWRVFQSYTDPRVERVTEPGRALAVMEQLEAIQKARMGTRCNYLLDAPAYRGFYRYRLMNGLKDGSVVLTALTSAGQVFAAAYGVRKEKTLTLVRVAFGGEQWKACAPGRLLMERTAHLMWQEGCRSFDLSIGSYSHKQTFGCSEYPLLELCTPLTWRGIPAALAWHAKHVLAPGATD
jgi:CelD/BcsL family acetyltransferase involved in cellulose biosynthesis